MYDFVAIDFETATYSRESACAIGITVVENMRPADEFYSLLRPPKNEYCEKNIAIHGITPDMTEDAPTLTELWPEIGRFFDPHVPVIAHNAVFDMSVLRDSIRTEIPNFTYADSMRMAKAYCPGRRSLPCCAETLGIDMSCFHHHNALDDAGLCAAITIEIIRRAGCLSMWEYLAKHPEASSSFIRSEKLPDDDAVFRYRAAPDPPRHQYEHTDPHTVCCAEKHIDINSPLYGKNIVFTGELSIRREIAMQMAVNCGACLKSSVSGKTDYLVVGTQYKELVGEDGLSSKEERAYELNGKGKAHVVFLTEDDFLKMVEGEKDDGRARITISL